MDGEFAGLWQRARAGDATAAARLIEGHVDGLRAFVHLESGALLRARESRSDLVQSICREALEGLAGARCADERAFRAWFFGIARHKLLRRAEYWRAQRREARREVPLEFGEAEAEGLLCAFGSFCTPSRDLSVREEVQRIEQAFEQLPEEHRRVIVGACLEGRPHAELARELGKSEAATRQLLTRARARLALLLAPRPGE